MNANASTIAKLENPHYQLRIEIESQGPNQTLVSVSAKITAWNAEEDPSRSQYVVVPSNGRLEQDMLDRLSVALEKGNIARSGDREVVAWLLIDPPRPHPIPPARQSRQCRQAHPAETRQPRIRPRRAPCLENPRRTQPRLCRHQGQSRARTPAIRPLSQAKSIPFEPSSSLLR